jgi:ATP adenylyltransferase
MSLEHLWSPWRMAYIQAADDPDADCVFCRLPEDPEEAERVLARTPAAYVVLNKFPYNPGHVLVVPRRHVSDLEELSAEDAAELHGLLRRSVAALRDASGPDGFNVGMNLGRVAGAGVPGHLHWHVVPRWTGDTNFTTVVGETRVLPELLAETARRLAPAFDRQP